jgi:hypothetical protein
MMCREVRGMNHSLLKKVITDQHQVIRESRICRRPYSFEKNGNYVLTGIRRAGKSTLLYGIVQDLIADGISWEQIIYINFEDERLAEFTREDFNDIIAVQSEMSDRKGYFFFDEVQNIQGWEKFARRMADSKERVYITGSNAKMLSKEIETTLGGRFLEKYVTPYSFEEYLTAREIPHQSSDLIATKARGRIESAFQCYLEEGGLPESLIYTSKREYLSTVLQKIILGDIASRNNLKNDYTLRMLIKKIAETICNEISYSKLHGTLKGIGLSTGKDTVIDYITYAKEAYLLFTVQNGFSAFSERESTPKYYFEDNGLLNLFLFDKSSILLENMVASALHRKYGDQFYFMKSSRTGTDVDFYVPERSAAIQVCVDINDSSFGRETGNLIKLRNSYPNVQELITVTMEESSELKVSGTTIRVIPAADFLLSWL